jgi:hypothetical protein
MAEMSELEMRVLAELGESRLEYFPALANGVLEVAGKDEEREQIKNAFENLVGAELAVVGIEREAPGSLDEFSKEHSLGLLADLAQHLKFDADQGKWVGSDPWPQLVITDVGLTEADKVIETRGWRWWLPSK